MPYTLNRLPRQSVSRSRPCCVPSRRAVFPPYATERPAAGIIEPAELHRIYPPSPAVTAVTVLKRGTEWRVSALKRLKRRNYEPASMTLIGRSRICAAGSMSPMRSGAG